MSKYDRLGAFLREQDRSEIPMTFAEIERVVGTKLPKSQSNPAWWSNSTSNNVMTQIWLDAGYRTEQVNTAARKLVFTRIRERRSFEEERRMFAHDETKSSKAKIHPLIGCMKGLLWIEPGYDLTQPAMPEWADLVDEKYGKETGRK